MKTIPAVMRQVAAATAVAAVLTMSGFGCSGKLPATGGCTFNSKLHLKVYVVREAGPIREEMPWLPEEIGPIPEEIGRTPSAKPIVIPRCAFWYVEPASRLDMRALAREIESKGLPGLRLSRGAADGHLAHLKGLTRLERLDLRYRNITDASLAHLKDLTGLREERVKDKVPSQ